MTSIPVMKFVARTSGSSKVHVWLRALHVSIQLWSNVYCGPGPGRGPPVPHVGWRHFCPMDCNRQQQLCNGRITPRNYSTYVDRQLHISCSLLFKHLSKIVLSFSSTRRSSDRLGSVGSPNGIGIGLLKPESCFRFRRAKPPRFEQGLVVCSLCRSTSTRCWYVFA